MLFIVKFITTLFQVPFRLSPSSNVTYSYILPFISSSMPRIKSRNLLRHRQKRTHLHHCWKQSSMYRFREDLTCSKSTSAKSVLPISIFFKLRKTALASNLLGASIRIRHGIKLVPTVSAPAFPLAPRLPRLFRLRSTIGFDCGRLYTTLLRFSKHSDHVLPNNRIIYSQRTLIMNFEIDIHKSCIFFHKITLILLLLHFTTKV